MIVAYFVEKELKLIPVDIMQLFITRVVKIFCHLVWFPYLKCDPGVWDLFGSATR